jgi:hypothetical protein
MLGVLDYAAMKRNLEGYAWPSAVQALFNGTMSRLLQV